MKLATLIQRKGNRGFLDIYNNLKKSLSFYCSGLSQLKKEIIILNEVYNDVSF